MTNSRRPFAFSSLAAFAGARIAASLGGLASPADAVGSLEDRLA